MSEIVDASLIMTVLNEERGLLEFLESLSLQTTIPSEIVVVDGGSTDATVQLLRGWDAPEGCRVRVDVFEGAGISEGRNRAIAQATNRLILVTDAGTRLDPRWCEEMLRAFPSSGDPAVVCGFFRPTGDTLMERAIAFTVTPLLAEIDPRYFLPSSRSVGLTRDLWESAGGYPEWLDYCEDLVFDLELKRLGATFVFQPDAIVSWSARPSLRAFVKQYYRYARGDGKASLWAKRHAARYAAYAGGVGLVVLGTLSYWWWTLLVLGLAAYQRKFFARMWAHRGELRGETTPALLLVPVIVVAGDLAKMVGYPAGLLWRQRHRRTCVGE